MLNDNIFGKTDGWRLQKAIEFQISPVKTIALEKEKHYLPE